MSEETGRTLLKRVKLDENSFVDENVLWTRLQHSWFYVRTCAVCLEDTPLSSEISRFVIILEAKDFDPEKYDSFLKVRANMIRSIKAYFQSFVCYKIPILMFSAAV